MNEHIGKRMTWEEIQREYPDQWVGLVGVIRKKDSPDVVSAIVKYTDKSKSELTKMQIQDSTHELYSCYTTPNNIFQLGTLG